MYSRQLEQLASQRSRELRTTAGRPDRPARRSRAHAGPLRRQTGWALVSLGLRIAESGSR